MPSKSETLSQRQCRLEFLALHPDPGNRIAQDQDNIQNLDQYAGYRPSPGLLI